MVTILSHHEKGNDTSQFRQKTEGISSKPIRLAFSFFFLALFFRVVDIFVLEMNTTDFGILPSKVFPILFILLYLRHREKRVSSIGIHSDDWQRNVFLAVLAILVFNGILYCGGYLVLFIINIQPQIIFYKLDYIAFDLVYQTANAFMEEMLFRGLMLVCFMTVMRPLKANLLQGLLFGLWHIVWPINSYLGGLISAGAAIGWATEYFFSSMIVGLLWGYMFQRTRSLLSPILLHFFINFISAYVFIEPSVSLIKLVLGLVGFLLTFVTVFVFTKKEMRYNKSNTLNEEVSGPPSLDTKR